MNQSYFEYHKIIEAFLAGQRPEFQAATLGGDVILNQHDCPDCQRRKRMKLAFINVLREEML